MKCKKKKKKIWKQYLQHLVFRFKIFDKEYFYLNYVLTILAYTIYKSYNVSEQYRTIYTE